jgi:hypothetical protein
MIETKIIDYLNSNLEANTYMEQPEEKPVRFYIMERTAGGETNHIREGSFSVQSYAPTLYEASLMNNAMINVFKGLVELPEVSRVVLNSDYNFTDPTTQQYRYQANFVVTYYERNDEDGKYSI